MRYHPMSDLRDYIARRFNAPFVRLLSDWGDRYSDRELANEVHRWMAGVLEGMTDAEREEFTKPPPPKSTERLVDQRYADKLRRAYDR